MPFELPPAHLWTNGAVRAIDRAGRVTVLLRDPAVTPLHLLWALLKDEGRAGAALEEVGIDTTILAGVHADLSRMELEQLGSAVFEGNWESEAAQILHEAQHGAHQAGVAGEVGTDFLLVALRNSATVAAGLLAVYDIPQTVVPAAARSHADLLGPPDFSEWPASVDLNLRERHAPNVAEVYRLIDAAANRGREGLRVVEDYARFGLNDAHLSGQLKQLRHEFTRLLSEFPAGYLLACRDTTGDVGTTLEGYGEYRRTDTGDVLIAAFKRVQEAARTIEEYSKIVSGDLSRGIEQVRYRLYQIEKAMLQTFSNRLRLQNRSVYLLLTQSACAGGWLIVLKAALDAGVRLFQVREKSLPDRELLEHCRQLRRLTRDHDALLIINDRPDLAVLSDADGVHVGQDELSVADVRRIVGPDRLIGVSTHSIEQARRAVLDGADYIGVGPTFPSGTKTFTEFPGLELIQQVAAEITLPWFAIGGITEDNLSQVIASGARRVAITGAISGSSSPHEAAATILRELRSAGT